MARADNRITLTEAAERLGVHYMTAYRYVRTGRLPAVKDGQEWQVAPADIEALLHAPARGAAPTAADARRSRRTDYPSRLAERLLGADEAGAWTLVESALAGGMDPAAVYLDVFAPALADIGQRWVRGEITVADEHRSSAVMLRLIGRLGPQFARRGRKRGTIVLGTAPGESHGLPTALLRDLLRGRSFEVVDLGADVPVNTWAATVEGIPRLVAVGLCATAPGNDRSVRAAIRAIRAVTDVPVLLGGTAVPDDAHATRLGASARSCSFPDALARFAELIG